MDALIARLTQVVESNGREVIDEGHDVTVQAIAGAENIVFEITCAPGDVGLIIGRGGAVIEAIRTLVRAARRGVSVRTDVEVTKSRR